MTTLRIWSAWRGGRVRKVIAAAAVVALGAVALANMGLGEPAVKSVQLETVAEREIRPSVFAAGRIVHGNQVRLSSEVIGTVKEVHVVEGQTVEAGELVLAIDDAAYAAEVMRRQAAVRLQQIDMERKRLAIDSVQRQHNRHRRLFDRSMLDEHAFEATANRLRGAQIDLDSARELLAQAQAALAQASEQLDKTQVRAPLPGVVTSLDIEVGETAIASTTNVPGSTLMVIADPSSLLVEVYVDEADVSDVHVGQAAEVVAAAQSGEPMSGTVAFIANTAKLRPDGRGLSFRARIRLAADTPSVRALRPGMSCRAEVFLGDGGAVPAVPIRAIVSEDDLVARTVRHFVYVFAQQDADDGAGVVRKVPVTLGRSDDDFQEVLAGAESGDRIVVGSGRVLRQLEDGEAVASVASVESALEDPLGPLSAS